MRLATPFCRQKLLGGWQHNSEIPKEGYTVSFGRNLATIRKEKGLTQEALVQKSGVAISQIRRYEADKSSPTLDVPREPKT